MFLVPLLCVVWGYLKTEGQKYNLETSPKIYKTVNVENEN